jgi:hypothetical protein
MKSLRSSPHVSRLGITVRVDRPVLMTVPARARGEFGKLADRSASKDVSDSKIYAQSKPSYIFLVKWIDGIVSRRAFLAERQYLPQPHLVYTESALPNNADWHCRFTADAGSPIILFFSIIIMNRILQQKTCDLYPQYMEIAYLPYHTTSTRVRRPRSSRVDANWY